MGVSVIGVCPHCEAEREICRDTITILLGGGNKLKVPVWRCEACGRDWQDWEQQKQSFERDGEEAK